ncbi:MAG: hypothetical protein LBI29_03955 [Rickettsiales bacterium]|nr:hypothetical protein [Rickettsiales bacterium]
MFSFLDSIYSFNKDCLSLKPKTEVGGRRLTGICLLLLWFGSGMAGASSIIKISGNQSSRLVISDDQTVENEGSVSFKDIISLDQKGGAIFVSSGGTLNFDGGTEGPEGAIVFQNNYTGIDGGAIYVGSNAAATLRGNIKFEGNTAPYHDGGAIFVASGGTLNINGGTEGPEGAILFQDNSGSHAGTIYVEEGATAVLRGDIKFFKNGWGTIYNEGTLEFILETGNQIEFQGTVGEYDIYDRGTVHLDCVTGSVIKFSRGIGMWAYLLVSKSKHL